MPVSATENGVPVNPTALVVNLAFVTGALPSPGDWKAASWETDATTEPDTYYARALVGPGGVITLAPGSWDVWVKVTGAPEIPEKLAGQLLVI